MFASLPFSACNAQAACPQGRRTVKEEAAPFPGDPIQLLRCRSLGCLDPQCVLCEHNPHRRCNVNFAPKYLVNDVLKAKCDAPIRVEIIDRQTGVPLGEDLAEVHLEVCVYVSNVSSCHPCMHAEHPLPTTESRLVWHRHCCMHGVWVF